MNNYLLLLLIICFSIVGHTANGQSQNVMSPEGTVITEGGCSAECCFGRVSIFLFEDGNCVRRSIDEVDKDRVTDFGTWKLEASVIRIHYNTRFYGKPIGETTEDPNRCSERHSLYTAVRENIDKYESIKWEEQHHFELITYGHSTGDCYSMRNRDKYKAEFSQFNFLSTEIRTDKQRIVSEQYLVSLNKQELKFLRNEIFAKYGLKFSSADLKEHFEKPLYYDGFYNDVTAFLNEYDRINIELIQKYESLSNK